MKPKRNETPEQKAARLKKNEAARARRWARTGVSTQTVAWMKASGML